MKRFFALYRKELGGYYYSLLAYLFIIVFLVVLSWMTWQNLFVVGQVTMRDFFRLLPWFYLFLLPALTMRMWSEEKRQGTDETLLTLPVSDTQIVLAKFGAAKTFLFIILLFSLPLPFTLASLGTLDWGQVLASYLGAMLFGSAILAMGQWISALTKNQIVAFLITAGLAFLFMLFGFSFFVDNGTLISRLFTLLSTYTHFENIAKGIIDLRDVVYYLSFIVLFLVLNIQVLRKRRQFIRRTAVVVFIFAALITLNIAISSLVIRFDATEGKQYTLSQSTKTVVSDLPEPVTIKLYFTEKVPQDLYALRQDVGDVLREYDIAGGDKVNIEVINNPEDPSHAADLQKYGIPPIQFNVVGSEKFEVSQGYAGMAITYKDKFEAVPVISDTANLEYQITADIVKMSQESRPAVAFLEDHGVQQTSQLQQQLRDQYDVSTTTLKDKERVDEKVNTLVVAGPTEEFTNKEKYALDQFVMRGGKLILLLDGMLVNQQQATVQPNATTLEALITNYGTTVNADLVADFGSPETLQFGNGPFTVLQPYPLWPHILPAGINSDSPINTKIETITFPWPSSLTLTPQDGQQIDTLISSSPQSATLTDLKSISPEAVVQPSPDQLQATAIAAYVHGHIPSAFNTEEKPKDVDQSKFMNATDNGAIIVVSNSQFVSDQLLANAPQNAAFMMNSIDVLSQNTVLTDIRNRNALNRPIRQMSDTEKAITKYLNIFSSVIIVLLVSGGAYAVRRRNDKKARALYT